jgi:hypothetical protein
MWLTVNRELLYEEESIRRHAAGVNGKGKGR